MIISKESVDTDCGFYEFPSPVSAKTIGVILHHHVATGGLSMMIATEEFMHKVEHNCGKNHSGY